MKTPNLSPAEMIRLFARDTAHETVEFNMRCNEAMIDGIASGHFYYDPVKQVIGLTELGQIRGLAKATPAGSA